MVIDGWLNMTPEIEFENSSGHQISRRHPGEPFQQVCVTA